MRQLELPEKQLAEKTERLNLLTSKRPSKNCAHKEYSSPKDVRTMLEIEELEEEIDSLKAEVGKLRSQTV